MLSIFWRRNDGFAKYSFLHILDICKNQLVDFQALTHLKLFVLVQSEREHQFNPINLIN